MIDASDARARAVGNAVYLEHIGQSGDISAWGVGSHEQADEIAGSINELLNSLRSSLADSARKAGEYAHAMRGKFDAIEKERDTFRKAYDHVDSVLNEVRAERDRLRAALEMLAQIRHVSGSAQGAFRSNLRIIDAVLQGADVRDLETVEKIAEGTWKP